jgi:hypothetical protein
VAYRPPVGRSPARISTGAEGPYYRGRPLDPTTAGTSSRYEAATEVLEQFLAGQTDGTSTTTGDAQLTAGITATSAGMSTTTGGLSLTAALTVTTSGTSTTTGAAVETAALASTSAGTSTTAGTVVRVVDLTESDHTPGPTLLLLGLGLAPGGADVPATSAGTSTTTGDIARLVFMAGTSAGSSVTGHTETGGPTLLLLGLGLAGGVVPGSQLATVKDLAGTSTGTSTSTGLLVLPLAANSNGTSTTTGDLVRVTVLQGISSGTSTTRGGETPLAGVSAGSSTTGSYTLPADTLYPSGVLYPGQGTPLTVLSGIAGTTAASSITTGALGVTTPLAGTSTGTSTTTAALSLPRNFAGTTTGSSSTTGDLDLIGEGLGGTSTGTSITGHYDTAPGPALLLLGLALRASVLPGTQVTVTRGLVGATAGISSTTGGLTVTNPAGAALDPNPVRLRNREHAARIVREHSRLTHQGGTAASTTTSAGLTLLLLGLAVPTTTPGPDFTRRERTTIRHREPSITRVR